MLLLFLCELLHRIVSELRFYTRGLICLVLVAYFDYSSTLEMEAVHSSETSAKLNQTTQRRIPDDSILYSRGCENLKSSCFLYARVSFPTSRLQGQLQL
jgi:hypothetical protein